MSAWTLAWIESDVWRTRAHEDPTALEGIGAALRDLSYEDDIQRLPGFGRMKLDGSAEPYLESVPPLLVAWSAGELAIYPATSSDDVKDFLGNKNNNEDGGSVLIFAVDHDEADRNSALDVGEAILALLNGHETADLGNTMAGARVCARVGSQATVTFAWYRNDLTRTDRLSASARYEVMQILGGKRKRRRKQDSSPHLARLSILADTGSATLPIDPTALTVLLGRNGAGKTTVLEDIAFALEQIRGVESVDALKALLPSWGRRSGDRLPRQARAVFSVARQEYAPDLFRDVFFLMAYSPMAIHGMREVMPHGATMWDALTAIDSADAIDPRHVLTEYDLPTLSADVRAGMLAQVGGNHDRETLEAIFAAYLSSGEVALGDGGLIHYMPPDAASVSDIAGRISDDEYTELINNDARGHARNALFWALSALKPTLGSFVGMEAHHPRQGAFYAGWERSPWTEIHDDLVARLRESLPRIVVFDPDPGADGVDALAEQLLLDLARHLIGPRDIDEQAGAAHPFSSATVGPVAATLARHLGQRATSLLPGFAAAEGQLVVRIAPMEEWHRRRVVVEVSAEQRAVPLSANASGVLAWGTACLRFAAAELAASEWSSEGRDGRTIALISPDQLRPRIDGLYPFIYLADEPEAHLHPSAVQEIVGCCDRLAAASAGGVVVATHALEFLGRPDMVITPFLVTDGAAQALPHGLPALRERAHHLGVSPATVLLSARAVLCVEGPTDEWALATFTGGALDHSLVQTLRLYGMNHLADRFPELDLVHSLDIPIYILLDHVRTSKLHALITGQYVADPTKEERELQRLAQTLRGRRATIVPMAEVDILRTIPDEAMATAFEKMRQTEAWRGWNHVGQAIEQRWKETRLPFKDAFEAVTGLKADRVVSALRRLAYAGPSSPVLMRAVNSLAADLSSGGYRAAGAGLRVLP